jgi:hypothetical protein
MAVPSSSHAVSFPRVPDPLLEPPAPELGDTRLLQWIHEAGAIVDRCLESGGRGATAGRPALDGKRRERLVGLLGEWIESAQPCLSPTPDPRAPRAHACPRVEEPLGLPPGAGLDVLEHLAELGLLRRELHNLVHLCPDCASWKLNFREVCPGCRDIDLRLEPVLQHFRCAYAGLDSEFRRDFELVCPRCAVRLEELGRDFERPHHSWVCNACDDLFEEPLVEVQCLACGARQPAGEIEPVAVHRYRPTAAAVRAVEAGRLAGFDLEELLCDTRAGLDSRDFLRIEVAREVARMARHGGVFSVAVLEFAGSDGPRPVFDLWSSQAQRALGRVLGGLRSPLDLVARLDASRVGFLLPATDEAAARALGERLLGQLSQLDLSLPQGRARTAVEPRWRPSTWCAPDCDVAQVLGVLGLERGSP